MSAATGTRPTPSHAASQTRALWLIASLAALWALRLAADLLIPIVLGILASLALEPVVAWLVRRGLPRLAATTFVLLVLVGSSALAVYATRDRIVSGVQALPQALREAQQMLQERLEAAGLSGAPENAGQTPGRETTPPSTSPGQALPNAMSGAAAAAQRAAQSLLALTGNLMVILFLMFFLLQAGPTTSRRLVAMARSDERRRTVAVILDEVNAQVQRFLFVRLLTSAVVAAATWGVLAWMDAPNAMVWGLLAGLVNSIPYFGPVIVSGGLFVVGAVQSNARDGLEMAGAALLITSLEGWLLTPPLMGRAERMNVLSVFIGLLVWTWLWGAWGTLLAVPLLAVMKSVADHVEGLKPIGRLMAP